MTISDGSRCGYNGEIGAMAQKLLRLVGQFKIAGREPVTAYSISPRSSA